MEILNVWTYSVFTNCNTVKTHYNDTVCFGKFCHYNEYVAVSIIMNLVVPTTTLLLEH